MDKRQPNSVYSGQISKNPGRDPIRIWNQIIYPSSLDVVVLTHMSMGYKYGSSKKVGLRKKLSNVLVVRGGGREK